MPSSVIHDFQYDASRNELTVVFATGRAYVYSLVPPSVYQRLSQAGSKGRFFNAEIRNRYRHRRLIRRAIAPED